MTYTHILTKIGNAYRLTDKAGKEHPTTIKDWQSIRELLDRRGILHSTEGLSLLPDHKEEVPEAHALHAIPGAIS